MSRAAPLLLALTLGCRAPGEPPEPSAGALSEADASLTSLAGRAPRATGGFASVVSLEPENAPAEPPPGGEPAVLDQFGIAFSPRVLLARTGEVVTFRNGEDVLHNVHVKDRDSGETIFNVATLPYKEYTHRFDRPGVYDVSCDTHPAMAAFVIVTSAPYATVAESDGSFELEGVPEGRYRLRVWNLDPKRRLERDVTLERPRTEVALVP